MFGKQEKPSFYSWAVINGWLPFVLVMAKEYAKGFYKSKQWQECRDSYIKYRHGLCERCLAKGIVKAGVIVHHKEYISPDNIAVPEITTDFNNLELLCHECHNAEHFGSSQKRFVVDKFGRVSALG